MQGYKRKQTRHGAWVQGVLRGVLVLVLLMICILSVRATWGMYQKFGEASTDQELAQQQLQTLQQQKQSISAAVNALNSPQGYEAEVRERYGVVRPGEGEIQIIATQPSASSTPPAQQSIWNHLQHLFSLW